MTDRLLEEFNNLRPTTFGFLEHLELSRSLQPEKWQGFTLTIRLRASTEPGAKILLLTFNFVQDLRLQEIDGLLRFMIEIRSIRDLQLEHRNYKVVESEYNAFSFCCQNFEATILD